MAFYFVEYNIFNMIKLRYRKGEKQAMLKAGFPLCIPNRKTKGEHCNTCIKFYRKK